MKPCKRLAVFAHWDRDRIVDPYVLHYLEELSKLCDIIFVSDGELAAAELEKLKPLTIASIAERHGEYDFGSYKRGYLHALDRLGEYDELVFANDSCYGPFAPLEQMWETMEFRDCDFWGLLEHFDPTVMQWHVQSYFLVFKRQVFASEVFDSFMRSIRRQPTKDDVIIQYEVGLSATLTQAGFTASSICPPSEINLTHHVAAFELIEKHGASLLKKALLQRNPMRAPMLIDGLEKLEKTGNNSKPWGLMLANLERVAGSSYRNYWFHGNLLKKTLVHPKFLRFKEKPLRWMNVITIKLAGMTVAFIPWKVNFLRIRYDWNKRSAK